jgi:transcriptional regulator with XRE-family HTH domain
MFCPTFDGSLSPTMNRQSSEVNVQEVREAQGLSREGLASKAGLSLRTIERLESGEIKRPHRATVAVIATALDVDPALLLDEVVA